jgi:hypothetical protein
MAPERGLVPRRAGDVRRPGQQGRGQHQGRRSGAAHDADCHVFHGRPVPPHSQVHQVARGEHAQYQEIGHQGDGQIAGQPAHEVPTHPDECEAQELAGEPRDHHIHGHLNGEPPWV